MAIRVIVNNVSIYTTKTAIKRGIGDHIKINDAVQMAFVELERLRDGASLKPIGLTGHWNGYNVQIDL